MWNIINQCLRCNQSLLDTEVYLLIMYNISYHSIGRERLYNYYDFFFFFFGLYNYLLHKKVLRKSLNIE